jgi:hypothetical protein
MMLWYLEVETFFMSKSSVGILRDRADTRQLFNLCLKPDHLVINVITLRF